VLEPRQGSRLYLLGLVIGVWAVLPPYVTAFGDLHVESRVEVADHVVPGVIVLAFSGLAYLVLSSELALFTGGAVITLAGFWMVATHVGLISQVRNDIVPLSALLWHGLPGVAVIVLGLVWAIRFWGSEAEAEPQEVER